MKGRTGWRVTIDGRVYEGGWAGKPEAAYGAMLKDEINRSRATHDSMPPIPPTYGPGGLFRASREELEAKPEWIAWREAVAALHAEDAGPSTVTVEPIYGRRVTKKVHRYWPPPQGPDPQCSGPGYAHAPHGECTGYGTDRT